MRKSYIMWLSTMFYLFVYFGVWIRENLCSLYQYFLDWSVLIISSNSFHCIKGFYSTHDTTKYCMLSVQMFARPVCDEASNQNNYYS